MLSPHFELYFLCFLPRLSLWSRVEQETPAGVQQGVGAEFDALSNLCMEVDTCSRSHLVLAQFIE